MFCSGLFAVATLARINTSGTKQSERYFPNKNTNGFIRTSLPIFA